MYFPFLFIKEVSAATSSSGTASAPLAPVTSLSATSFFVTSASPSVVGLSAHRTADMETAPGSEPGWLPAKLMGTIPPQDQKWISSALWKNKQLRTDLKLWYDPPEPALIYHQAPAPERFFYTPASLVDAIPPLAGKAVLSCVWKTAHRLWSPQESPPCFGCG